MGHGAIATMPLTIPAMVPVWRASLRAQPKISRDGVPGPNIRAVEEPTFLLQPAGFRAKNHSATSLGLGPWCESFESFRRFSRTCWLQQMSQSFWPRRARRARLRRAPFSHSASRDMQSHLKIRDLECELSAEVHIFGGCFASASQVAHLRPTGKSPYPTSRRR